MTPHPLSVIGDEAAGSGSLPSILSRSTTDTTMKKEEKSRTKRLEDKSKKTPLVEQQVAIAYGDKTMLKEELNEMFGPGNFKYSVRLPGYVSRLDTTC